MRKEKKERGVSLLTVIVMIVLFAILGFVAVSMFSMGIQKSVNYLNSEKAFYIAEAGTELAFRLIKDHWNWQTKSWQAGFNFDNYKEGEVGEGNFSVSVTPVTGYSDRLKVTSTGNYKNAYRSLQTLALKKEALDFAIYSNSKIVMRGSAIINGDIMETSNIPIEISGNAQHNGEIYYTDHRTVPSLAPVPNNDPCPHKPPCPNYYMCLAKRQDQYFTGKRTFANRDLNGIIYVDGDLQLTGTSSTTNPPAVLVVMGDLDITGNVNFKGLIYTLGTLKHESELLGNAKVEGAVIAGNPINPVGGNFTLTYNSSYVKTSLNESVIVDNYFVVINREFKEIKTP